VRSCARVKHVAEVGLERIFIMPKGGE
jgi:hypothetical protein